MSTQLSGKRRPGEHVSNPLLNEITDALKTQDSMVLSDAQKLRLEGMLVAGQIHDSVTGHVVDASHEILSSKKVTVLRGKPGAGIEWRFEAV